MLRALFTVLVLMLKGSVCSFAENNVTFSGHVKSQLGATHLPPAALLRNFGPATPSNGEFNTRLITGAEVEHFTFDVQGEFLAITGDSLRAGRRLENLLDAIEGSPTSVPPDRARLFGLQTDRRRFFGLTSEVLDDNSSQAVARLDRMTVGYTTEQGVLRIGRQALTLGNGMVFQALDVLNPFAPTAIDKDYKSGDDMLYTQYLFSDGSDVSAVGIPRRDPSTHELESDQSSAMARYQRQFDALTVQVLGGAHYGEAFFGFGASRSVFDGIIRSDVAFEDVADTGIRPVIVLNFDRTWEIHGMNVSSFVEYYHNEIGVSDARYKAPGEALLNRLFRGEVFTLGRDYLALGGQLELSPLVNFYPLVITNLGDSSGVFQLRLLFDLLQDARAQIGCSLPYGPSESEFGGFELKQDTELSPGKEAFVRLSYYFSLR